MQNAYIKHQISCLDQLDSCESLISTQPLQTRENFYQAKDHLPAIMEPSQKWHLRNRNREVSRSLNAKSELFSHQNQVANSYGIQDQTRFTNSNNDPFDISRRPRVRHLSQSRVADLPRTFNKQLSLTDILTKERKVEQYQPRILKRNRSNLRSLNFPNSEMFNCIHRIQDIKPGSIGDHQMRIFTREGVPFVAKGALNIQNLG